MMRESRQQTNGSKTYQRELQVTNWKPCPLMASKLCTHMRVLYSDGDGNWKVGAMATLIDDVGAAAIYSLIGHIKVSLDFNISYYSTAKTQEEVEIEAKVVGEKGKLMSVVTEVRKKDNGQLIALGRQWMASSNVTSKASKL
ncbi:uncharacterized protein LOC8273831 isoform X2 [Ricinus communis]|uniref:uncharacterized protein LOC8273831 isoform X2 n=1 Tax=Ricinus communis TaxID=3988 RepID=UPI00201A5635|nr:uncharacterized protein LOC8273831 isoform X2 [Ricinus communis]